MGRKNKGFLFLYVMERSIALGLTAMPNVPHCLQNLRGRLYHARLSLTMNAKHNSSYCISKGNCKPLGGFSSWAAMPPLAEGAALSKPTTLVVAQIDGMDMFHDSIQVGNGGDSYCLRIATLCPGRGGPKIYVFWWRWVPVVHHIQCMGHGTMMNCATPQSLNKAER